MTAANPIAPLSVGDLAKRFRRGNRWAAALMRKMQHFRHGRELFTTEEWLAEWVATTSIPAMKFPSGRNVSYNPLEDLATARVVAIVGDLARQGKIRVFNDGQPSAPQPDYDPAA